MHYFSKIWAPPFCTVFSTICGTFVEENEKTQGDRNSFFGTPWPIWRWRDVEISVRDMCHKNSRFYHVLSVICGAVGVCRECHRVGHVVISFYN